MILARFVMILRYGGMNSELEWEQKNDHEPPTPPAASEPATPPKPISHHQPSTTIMSHINAGTVQVQ
jgi:hypothetical protein